MSGETCAACRFFAKPAEMGQPGFCRRNPPTAVMALQMMPIPKGAQMQGAPAWGYATVPFSLFPPVMPDNFCGMYAPPVRLVN